ncbi:MAG TPA: outer membrane beta-barrel protein [Verrucomicrobiae bacterium]|nr:outer membrane beta-barrel protein [Verrucomicrobiae bacterium]
MKFNKWTVGLAAVGVVCLASAARADEQKMSVINTALSNTTLSGYVDTSAQWNLGQQGGGSVPAYSFSGGKGDGFNFNGLDITLDKPEDESPWASGYHVELNLGPDTVATPRQAYVTLRTPVGNGIDWKVGVWDTIIGYESSSAPLNPNYTRSYGYTIEPTTHTGILGTYKINDEFTVSAGVADGSKAGVGPAGVNGRLAYETQKAYMGSVAFTAPDSWGWVKGATLSAGVIDAAGTGLGTTSLYVGATVPTPISALKFGGSFDFLDIHNNAGSDPSAWIIGLYSTYQVTEKLSLNARGEYINDSGIGSTFSAPGAPVLFGGSNGEELTLDAQYNLWANVISRVEIRWDHAESGNIYNVGGNGTGTPKNNAALVAAQIIYQF